MDESRVMEEDKLPVYPWNDRTGSKEALGMLSFADLENALTLRFKTQLVGKIREREIKWLFWNGDRYRCGGVWWSMVLRRRGWQ